MGVKKAKFLEKNRKYILSLSGWESNFVVPSLSGEGWNTSLMKLSFGATTEEDVHARGDASVMFFS